MPMKNGLLSILLFVFLGTGTALAQTQTKYTLTFKNLPIEQVKPVIAIARSIFDGPVEVENDNYDVLMFRSNKTVTQKEVEDLFTRNGFKLVGFKSEEE